ncbi:hypothetical protein D3C73_1197180 [compost metagenome]
MTLIPVGNLLQGHSGAFSIDTHQVADLRLIRRIKDNLTARVGCGAAYFFADHIRRVQQGDIAAGIRVAFAHLLGTVIQGHNPCTDFRNIRLRNREEFAKTVVEASCQITRQLQVLLLVFPYGYQIGIVDQNIGSHQRRVHEQTCTYGIFA